MNILRSMLFTPGNNPRMMAKAGLLGADAVILDLEDAVPLADKDKARLLVKDAIAQPAPHRSGVWVRVNSLTTGMTDEDLRSVIQPGLSGIVLPKVESASDVQRFADATTGLEKERGLSRQSIRLMPILESAKGILAAREIARANSRVVALAFGAVDFTRDMGIRLTREGVELQYARSYIAIAARAAELLAVDTPCIDLTDPERLAADARAGKDLGFRGKLLIHPAQVPVVNQVFSPAEDEVSYARKVVEAFRDAQRQGFGAISLEGKMIDVANYRQAEELIALADALAAIEKI